MKSGNNVTAFTKFPTCHSVIDLGILPAQRQRLLQRLCRWSFDRRTFHCNTGGQQRRWNPIRSYGIPRFREANWTNTDWWR